MMVATASATRGRLRLVVMLLSMALLAACGGESMPTLEDRVRAAWQEVRNQDQRRAELIPPILAIIKREAPQEREIVAEVSGARDKTLAIPAGTDTVTDAGEFKRYQEAQDQLGLSLERLGATIDRYLEIKSAATFVALRTQLRDAQIRLSVARRDYSEAARAYNAKLTSLPGRWVSLLEYQSPQAFQVFAATAPGTAAP